MQSGVEEGALQPFGADCRADLGDSSKYSIGNVED